MDDSAYLGYFNLGSYAWPVHELYSRRAQMSDLLIFDILLTAGGIRQPHLLYPPSDPESLKSLLVAIDNSTYDSLKRDCLVYFLLKWHNDGADRHVRFAAERSIPVQFTMLADAYWSLDAGRQVALAVSTLADSRLNRDYSSKILQAISLSPLSAPLVLKYVRTAKPPLVEPDDIDIYTLALAQTSLPNAWRFVRTFADKDETKDRLVKNILKYCLAPQPKPTALSSLLTLPFTSYELNLIQTFALSPQSIPATSVPILHDLIFTHLIGKADYNAALNWARTLEASPLSTREHVKKAIEERRDQVEVLKNMLGGLDPIPAQLPASSDMNVDIDASWQDLSHSLSGKVMQPLKPVEEPAANATKADPPQILSGLFPTNIMRTPLASIPPPPAMLPQPPILTPSKPTLSAAKTPFYNASTPTAPFSNGKMRNAFYEPPPPPPPVTIVDNIKRAREEETAPETGVDQESEDEAELIRRARRRIHHDGDTDMEVEPTPPPQESQEFGASVFKEPSPEVESPTAPVEGEEQVNEEEHEDKKKKVSKDKRPKKMERVKSRQLPGAFVEGEAEPQPAPQTSLSTRLSSRKSTSAKVSAAPTRTSSRRSVAASSSTKSISIPGSLISEEEEEETDRVPPLPKPKKVKEVKEAATPRRRSSRLSTDRSVESMTSTRSGRTTRKKA